MNIFILDKDPKQAAIMQCDKHVVKMILESAQMLCTAHNVLDGVVKEGFYKTTHINHPCNVWLRESRHNYVWLYKHLLALCEEYTFRYNKTHQCQWSGLVNDLRKFPVGMKSIGPTHFAIAMGSNPECINEKNPVSSYRKYYKTKKDKFKMVWTNRDVPPWFNKENLDLLNESL